MKYISSHNMIHKEINLSPLAEMHNLLTVCTCNKLADKTQFKLLVTETTISHLRLTQFLLNLIFKVFTP